MDLTPEALDMLLASLDTDREEAGRKYVDLLRKLAKLLGYWGCSAPQDQADDALARTAARMRAGEQIENLYGYILGVAHLVYKESVRDEISQGHAEKQRLSEANIEQAEKERRARCYRRCFSGLPDDEQDLIVKYYSGRKGPDRGKLAKEMGISLSLLRVSAFRIRQKLAQCLEKCIKQQPQM
jgi:DNA-directed RNA polymerase specialized sigma24 family protein